MRERVGHCVGHVSEQKTIDQNNLSEAQGSQCKATHDSGGELLQKNSAQVLEVKFSKRYRTDDGDG